MILNKKCGMSNPGNRGFSPVGVQIIQFRWVLGHGVGIILNFAAPLLPPLLEFLQRFVRTYIINVVITDFWHERALLPSSVS
jgi:hypothetical protein